MTFVDIIKDIADKAIAEIGSGYFLYGHPLEIFNTLVEKSQSETFKYSKYPLIALFQDFEEDTNDTRVIVNNVTIVIMTETSRDYKAGERYTNTFTPTLIPLYNEVIRQIKRSRYVFSNNNFQHTKIDRLYYGKEDAFGNSGNIGNDALDAVIIKGLNLQIVTNC
jgi:hypothetical protein